MIQDKFGDEMENVFEKRQFLSVTTYFFENFFEKKNHFCVLTTYFPENFFEEKTILNDNNWGMRDWGI